jgi:hypothetical protein
MRTTSLIPQCTIFISDRETHPQCKVSESGKTTHGPIFLKKLYYLYLKVKGLYLNTVLTLILFINVRYVSEN